MGCGGSPASSAGTTSTAEPVQVKAPEPKAVYPEVVAEYPHDPGAYTQGLLWHDGKLYESTGEYGHSSIRQVDLKTGKVGRKADLSNRFFGEGLALVGDSLLYQLTWQEQRCLVYRLSDFRQVASFAYQGEGWGLTTRGDSLYMTDGTAWIRVMDPNGFKMIRRFQVRDADGPVIDLNELEWIDGRIWANVYLTNRIAVIDPQTGFVTHYINCEALETKITLRRDTDVFNGIAVDDTGRIFVTGKRWDKLFEIKVKLD